MLDLENVGLAVEISVISCVLPCLEAEIHAFEMFGRHLGFFHFRSSHTVSVSIPMERWIQTLGNAVGISLISCLRAEIQRLLFRFLGKFYNFRLAAAILELLMMMDMPGLCHLIAQTYLGNVIEGYLSTTCGSEMAAKRSAWGVILPPPPPG